MGTEMHFLGGRGITSVGAKPVRGTKQGLCATPAYNRGFIQGPKERQAPLTLAKKHRAKMRSVSTTLSSKGNRDLPSPAYGAFLAV